MAEKGKHRSETVVLDAPEPIKALSQNEADVTNSSIVRVGAYAVRFSGPDEKDLSGEYFTKNTDFGPNEGNGAFAMFNHGESISEKLDYLADLTFGACKSFKDDIGVFIETCLDLADEYQQAIYDLICANKLAWSTGSASHVVKKAPDGQILRWPIVETSFTPMPCEPRLPKITPLKSVSLDDKTKEVVTKAFEKKSAATIKVNLDTTEASRQLDLLLEKANAVRASVDNSQNAKAKSSPQPQNNMADENKDKKPETRTVDLDAERKAWQKAENDRRSGIRAEAKNFETIKGVSELTEKAIDGDTTVDDFRKSLLAHIKENSGKPMRSEASGIEVVERNGAERGDYNVNRSAKSVGEALVTDETFVKAAKSGSFRGRKFELPNVKATLLTSTGPFTNYERPPGIVTLEQQRLTVRDLLAQGETSANSIRYVQEDTYTNGATTVAEEGQKPEASWDLSEVDAPVRKIAVLGRVSDEAFSDFPYLRSYVDGRLRFMLKEREEAQLLNGNGSGSNLTGILQTSGIQTQARGTDSHGDAVFKAMFDKVFAVGKFQADSIVIHPTDYSTMARAKDANDQYFGGGYFYAPYGNGMVGQPIKPIWGLNTVVTTAITQGTALVGAFKLGAMIFDRLGVTVETTNSDASDFQYNRIAIRVEERLGIAVWRPTAFCKVTGL